MDLIFGFSLILLATLILYAILNAGYDTKQGRNIAGILALAFITLSVFSYYLCTISSNKHYIKTNFNRITNTSQIKITTNLCKVYPYKVVDICNINKVYIVPQKNLLTLLKKYQVDNEDVMEKVK